MRVVPGVRSCGVAAWSCRTCGASTGRTAGGGAGRCVPSLGLAPALDRDPCRALNINFTTWPPTEPRRTTPETRAANRPTTSPSPSPPTAASTSATPRLRQRGSNEDTNNLLSEHFPRSTFNFRTYPQTNLNTIARELDGHPARSSTKQNQPRPSTPTSLQQPLETTGPRFDAVAAPAPAPGRCERPGPDRRATRSTTRSTG